MTRMLVSVCNEMVSGGKEDRRNRGGGLYVSREQRLCDEVDWGTLGIETRRDSYCE